MSGKLPKTTAQVRVTDQSWHRGVLVGEVTAGDFAWQFEWNFRRGRLQVVPSHGRALIVEPLGRFLEKWDYRLEPGGDYSFTIRARF